MSCRLCLRRTVCTRDRAYGRCSPPSRHLRGAYEIGGVDARLLRGQLAYFPSQPPACRDYRLLGQIYGLAWARRAWLGLPHPAGAARHYSRAGESSAWLPQPADVDRAAGAPHLQAHSASGRWRGGACGGDGARCEHGSQPLGALYARS